MTGQIWSTFLRAPTPWLLLLQRTLLDLEQVGHVFRRGPAVTLPTQKPLSAALLWHRPDPGFVTTQRRPCETVRATPVLSQRPLGDIRDRLDHDPGVGNR